MDMNNLNELADIVVPKYPCHTQVVERCVKIVTEASKSVCGFEARDARIRSKIKSREMMPCFKSKMYFKQ